MVGACEAKPSLFHTEPKLRFGRQFSGPGLAPQLIVCALRDPAPTRRVNNGDNQVGPKNVTGPSRIPIQTVCKAHVSSAFGSPLDFPSIVEDRAPAGPNHAGASFLAYSVAL